MIMSNIFVVGAFEFGGKGITPQCSVWSQRPYKSKTFTAEKRHSSIQRESDIAALKKAKQKINILKGKITKGI